MTNKIVIIVAIGGVSASNKIDNIMFEIESYDYFFAFSLAFFSSTSHLKPYPKRIVRQDAGRTSLKQAQFIP